MKEKKKKKKISLFLYPLGVYNANKVFCFVSKAYGLHSVIVQAAYCNTWFILVGDLLIGVVDFRGL